MSANTIYVPTNKTTMAPDLANGVAYLTALAHGTVEDPEIFQTQAQGYIDNLAQVKALGGTLGTSTSASSFPNALGALTYQGYALALPGAPVQSNGWPLGSTGDGRLWQLYRAAVSSRNINIVYQTPATGLRQTPAALAGSVLPKPRGA